jgi:hypothetical protein
MPHLLTTRVLQCGYPQASALVFSVVASVAQQHTLRWQRRWHPVPGGLPGGGRPLLQTTSTQGGLTEDSTCYTPAPPLLTHQGPLEQVSLQVATQVGTACTEVMTKMAAGVLRFSKGPEGPCYQPYVRPLPHMHTDPMYLPGSSRAGMTMSWSPSRAPYHCFTVLNTGTVQTYGFWRPNLQAGTVQKALRLACCKGAKATWRCSGGCAVHMLAAVWGRLQY